MNAPVFEKLLEEVGDSGRYQKLLFWLFVVPINFLIPWVSLVPIFMTSTPDHWCHVPGRPEDVPLEEWKALTIPREKDEPYSSCLQYNVTASDLLPLLDHPPSPAQINTTFGITGCQHLWEYDNTFYDSTLSMRQHWVCERASMAANWQSVAAAGNVVGTFVFNSLSDQVLPESPRWLLSRGRLDQCARVLENIAAKNGKKVPESLQETLQTIIATHSSENNYGALQLFKYPLVRIRTLLLTICYTCYNLFYYGLAYNMTNVSGNEFWNFFLLGIVELPSNLLGWLSSQTLGRRWTAAGASMLAASCAFATVFLQAESKWVPLMVLMLSKIFISISFMVVYVQCAEVYPTTHRAAGTGFSSLVSSCFGVTAPYIAYLTVYGAWVPYIILFGIGLVGYLAASLLPETLDADLPQSLLDANSFLTSEKYWSYKGRRCCTSKTPKQGRSREVECYDNAGSDPPACPDKF